MSEALFRPVRAPRPFEMVVAQIADAIMVGNLAVGERLPPERELAAQMEISRPTLREAESILIAAGVLEARGRGTYVLSGLIPVDILEQGVAMRVSQAANVIEMRRLLEPRIAQLAGLRATNQDFEYFEHLLALQREHQANRQRMIALDTRFHLAIARATHNPLIVEQATVVMRHHERARLAVVETPLAIDIVIKSHEEIVSAIAAGDEETIARAVDEHLRWFEQMWEEIIGRPKLRMPRDFPADLSNSAA